MGQLDEAETILRDGLTHHGTYLSAWMSLGRILAEKGEHREAVEALLKALAIDPGNVVCAKLLVTSYLALGDTLEAVKKLKLVRAVMPGDDEIDEQIARLEGEISGTPARPAGFAAPAPSEPMTAAPPAENEPEATAEPPAAEASAEPGVEKAPHEAPERAREPAPQAEGEQPLHAEGAEAFPSGEPETIAAASTEIETGPMAEPPSEEPEGESPVPEPSASRPFITEPDEEPEPAHEQPLEAAGALPEEEFPPPFEADRPVDESVPDAAPESVPRAASEPEAPAEEPAEPFPPEEPLATAAALGESWPSDDEKTREEPAAIADDRTATLTMAELYSKQGHEDAAREIYERVLERDPANEEVRSRLAALSESRAAPEPSARHEAAARLERWLHKVGRREL